MGLGRLLPPAGRDRGREVSESAELNTLADWMIAHGYVTGHGDTAEDLLAELVAQVSSAAAEKETG